MALCSEFNTFHTIIRHAIQTLLKVQDVILCDLNFEGSSLCKPKKSPTILPTFKHILQRENVTHFVIPNTQLISQSSYRYEQMSYFYNCKQLLSSLQYPFKMFVVSFPIKSPPATIFPLKHVIEYQQKTLLYVNIRFFNIKFTKYVHAQVISLHIAQIVSILCYYSTQ